MSMTSERRNRVFIGGISDRVQKEDIEKEFGRFGKLNSVWVAQNPPGFAFVEYENADQADLAVIEMNGKPFLHSPNNIRVEHSHGGGRGGRGARRQYDNGRQYNNGNGYNGRYRNESGNYAGNFGGYRNGPPPRDMGYNRGGGGGGGSYRNRYDDKGGRPYVGGGYDRGYNDGGYERRSRSPPPFGNK